MWTGCTHRSYTFLGIPVCAILNEILRFSFFFRHTSSAQKLPFDGTNMPLSQEYWPCLTGQMDPSHKRILRRNYARLKRDLSPVGHVLNALLSEEIISEDDVHKKCLHWDFQRVYVCMWDLNLRIWVFNLCFSNCVF